MPASKTRAKARRPRVPSRLRTLERARKVTAASNKVMVRAVHENQLLGAVCRIMVEEGGYTMAWVGMVRHDEARTIECVAAAGRDHERFSARPTSWADNEDGSGPSGLAVRRRKPQIIKDVRIDRRFKRMRSLAVELGFSSAAVLPLICAGELIGVLGILAAEPQSFEQAELDLLVEMADDLAYGYCNLRNREAHRRAEEKVADNERRFHATFDLAPVGITHIAPDGEVLLANARFEQIMGYGPGKLLGRNMREFLVAEDRPINRGLRKLRERLTSGAIDRVTQETRLLRNDGEPVWVELTIALIRDAGGKPLYDLTTVVDISERKFADAEIHRSEERYRHLTQLVADWYWEQDEQYRFTLMVSQAPGKIVPGLPHEQALGKQRWELGYRNMTDADWAAHRAQLDARESFHDLDLQTLDPHGVPIWIRVSGHPVFDPSGRFTGYRGIARDITQRKRSDQMRNLERAVATALATAQDDESALNVVLRTMCEFDGWECARYFEWDERERVLRCVNAWGIADPSIQRFIEGSRELVFAAGVGIVGRAWQTGQPAGSRDIREDPSALRHGLALASGVKGVFAFPIMVAGQCIGVVSLSSRSHREADELVLRAASAIGSQVGQFIQRKRAEDALRVSEERFRSLSGLVSDWYWEQDENYRFTNLVAHTPEAASVPAAQALMGRTRWELPYINMTAADWAAHRAVLDAHEPFHDLTLQSQDEKGAPFWARVSGHPLFDSSGRFTGYRGIARNITEIVRAEQLQKLEHAVAAALAGAQEPEDAIASVIRTLCELDSWDCGRYFELDEKAGLLRFAGSWSIEDPGIQGFIEDSRSLSFAPGTGLAGRALQSGEPIWTGDIRQDARALRKDVAVATSITSAFAFPVISAGKCIGVLSLSSRRFREADERALRAVSAIGSQVGQFIHRRRTEEALRQSEERFRSLTELSSDWYWEQDSDLRFTAVTGQASKTEPTLGIARWDLPGTQGVDWSAHRAMLEAHEPFRDFEVTHVDAAGERRYFSVSGQPVFDAKGAFCGYRGTGRDITEQRRIEDELRRFRTSMDMSGDMILIIDRASMRFIDVNSLACRLLGYSREELLALGPSDIMPESREQLERNIDRNIANASPLSYRRGVYYCKDGTELPFEATRCLLQSQGQWLVVVIARDIRERIAAEQERKQAEEHIRNQARQQRLIAEFGRQALGNVDLADVLNQAVRLIREALDTDFCDFLELNPDGRALTLKAAAGRPEGWVGHHVVPLAEGSVAMYQLERSAPVIIEDLHTDSRFAGSGLREQGVRSGLQVPIYGTKGHIGLLGTYSARQRNIPEEDVNFLGSVANILAVAIERKEAEDRLAYLAQFDSLTGLPNRHLFHDRLAQTLAQAKRNSALMAVLFIDLDRFKLVNDTLGHAFGDKLLKEAALRLQQCVRSSDTVGRLGGDEFSAILSELSKPGDASLVAQKIIDALGQPFWLDGHETYVSASIGITVFPDDGEAAGALIMNADAAMYRAKEQGRNNFQYFTREMNERALVRVNMESQLRRALERAEFTLHYQPRIALSSGAICGFEALLRWRHPDGRLIPPAEFIPVLEDTGLIVPVGEWVLTEACQRVVEWQSRGLVVPPVAVNLSARQFQQKDLESSVRRIVRATAADALLLQFEITESLLMDDPEAAARILRGLRDSGVKLSVDDFGTGYSSLAYLKRFPLDALKIDRAFVRDIATDPEDAAIALAIIKLAHTLELQVVAEGVETEAQLDFLTSHGCDEMQGFYFSPPVEPAVCETMLREGAHLVRGGMQLVLKNTPQAA